MRRMFFALGLGVALGCTTNPQVISAQGGTGGAPPGTAGAGGSPSPGMLDGGFVGPTTGADAAVTYAGGITRPCVDLECRQTSCVMGGCKQKTCAPGQRT